MKSVQPPITAGQVVAAYSASSVNDTDWHSLNSSDFYDPISGAQLAADLSFSFVGVNSSNTTTSSFIKLRAAAGAGDGKTNADGVIEIQASYSVDVAAIDGGNLVTNIAYAKAAGSDKFTIYAGFNR
jgi:hypothetical protein